MESILYLAHTERDGTLARSALEVLSTAVDISRSLAGSSLAIGLWGAESEQALHSISASGATRLLSVTGEEFSAPRYATDAVAAEALARAAGATIVVAPTTSRSTRVLAGLSRRLGGRIDTHISGATVEGDELHVQRWYYRQRIVATLTRTERPWILGVESGIAPPWSEAPVSAAVERVHPELPEDIARTRVVGEEEASADAQTIRPDAELLFVAGAGWTKKQTDGEAHVAEAESLIRGFLECTNASLGSSKSLVDQSSEGQAVLSILTHLNQVGQTGSTPRHPKGLATCCHGEEPHTVGWRFIGERRAVNLDPGCGWAQGKADVLYVADAFQVVARVNEILRGGTPR